MNTAFEDSEKIINMEDLKQLSPYSTLDIVKALGIPRERLRDWMSREYILPTLPATGQGSKAGFSKSDIIGIALFDKLLKFGFKRETASKIVLQFVGLDSPLGFCDYLVFKYIEKGNDDRIDFLFTVGQDIGGALSAVKKDISLLESNGDEKWFSVQIINMIDILREVERALKKVA